MELMPFLFHRYLILKLFFLLSLTIPKNIFTSHVGRIDRIGRKEYIDEILKAGIKIENFGPGTPGGFINAKKKLMFFNEVLLV